MLMLYFFPKKYTFIPIHSYGSPYPLCPLVHKPFKKQKSEKNIVRKGEMKLNPLLNIFTSLILLLFGPSIQWSDKEIPTPLPWPEQFHALLYMNLTPHLQITDLWYDWPKGRNVNIMQKQLGVLLYDVEWNNGTSFYFTLGENATCEVMYFEVGIPTPDFLDGAIYLGTEAVDGFLCYVWEKVDFLWYYEDVLTRRPVRWDFYAGISTHVIKYEIGAVLDDSIIQAPANCFGQGTDHDSTSL